MDKSNPRRVAILAPVARRDIRKILRWSEEKFGRTAAKRYEDLLVQAIRDIEADPLRPGTKMRAELLRGTITYHLLFSRDRVSGDKVKDPRHFLAYRVKTLQVEILRVLHDGSDLPRHLPSSYRPEE